MGLTSGYGCLKDDDDEIGPLQDVSIKSNNLYDMAEDHMLSQICSKFELFFNNDAGTCI